MKKQLLLVLMFVLLSLGLAACLGESAYNYNSSATPLTTATPLPSPTPVPVSQLSVSELPTRTNTQGLTLRATITNGYVSRIKVAINSAVIFDGHGNVVDVPLTLTSGENLIVVTAGYTDEKVDSTWQGKVLFDSQPPNLVSSSATVVEEYILKVVGIAVDQGGGKAEWVQVYGSLSKTYVDDNGGFDISLPYVDYTLRGVIQLKVADDLGNESMYSVQITPPTDRWVKYNSSGEAIEEVLVTGFNPFDPEAVGYWRAFWGYGGDYWVQYVNNVPQEPQNQIPLLGMLKAAVPTVIVIVIIAGLLAFVSPWLWSWLRVNYEAASTHRETNVTQLRNVRAQLSGVSRQQLQGTNNPQLVSGEDVRRVELTQQVLLRLFANDNPAPAQTLADYAGNPKIQRRVSRMVGDLLEEERKKGVNKR